MAMRIAFKKLGIEKIVASVHKENISAYKMDMNIGYQVVGKHLAHIGGSEDVIEISEAVFSEVNTFTEKIVLL